MGSLSILTVTIHILAWICSLQTLVVAKDHLHLTHYTHEIRGGPNSTFLLAAGTPQPNLAAISSVLIDLMNVLMMAIEKDNVMMTEGFNMNSTLVGRVTGTATGIVNPTTIGGHGTRTELVAHHVYGDASIYNGSYINVLGIAFNVDGPTEWVVHGCTGILRGYSWYGICEQILQTIGPPPLYLTYKWDFYLTKA